MNRTGGWLAASIFLLLVCSLERCRPATETYLRDVILNYEEVGFLSSNILQVHCQTEDSLEEPLLIRKQLLTNCRENLLAAIFQYRANYELNWRSLIETSKPVPVWSYEVSFTQEQKQKLESLYGDLLPGRVIYEEYSDGFLKAVYRLEKENLIYLIQSRELPFRVAIMRE